MVFSLSPGGVFASPRETFCMFGSGLLLLICLTPPIFKEFSPARYFFLCSQSALTLIDPFWLWWDLVSPMVLVLVAYDYPWTDTKALLRVFSFFLFYSKLFSATGFSREAFAPYTHCHQ